jgi:hypothetical protein
VGGPRSPSGRTENLVSTGILSPDRPAPNDTPYRTCYPGRHFIKALFYYYSHPQVYKHYEECNKLIKTVALVGGLRASSACSMQKIMGSKPA